jgi:hypothetical protein
VTIRRGERKNLLNHSWNQVKTVFDRRGAALELVALISFSNFIGTQALGGIKRMRQGSDTLSVNTLQLVNHLQDLAQVINKPLGLIIANR